jgi:hypothetical protein
MGSRVWTVLALGLTLLMGESSIAKPGCVGEDPKNYFVKTEADLAQLRGVTCINDLIFDEDNQLEKIDLALDPVGTTLEGDLKITGRRLKVIRISEKIGGVGRVTVSGTQALEYFYLKGNFGLVTLENNNALRYISLDVFANDVSYTDTVVIRNNHQLEAAFIKLGYYLHHHGPHFARVENNANLKMLRIRYPESEVINNP